MNANLTIYLTLYGGNTKAGEDFELKNGSKMSFYELHHRIIRLIERTIDGNVQLIVGGNSLGAKSIKLIESIDHPLIERLELLPNPEENLFKYPRMAQAINIADTEFFLCADDDIVLRSGWYGYFQGLIEHQDRPFLAGQARVYNASQAFLDTWKGYLTSQPIEELIRKRTRSRKMPQISFVRGSLWMTETRLLREVGFPPKELIHNLGDRLLGLIAREQSWKIIDIPEGLVIDNLIPRRGPNAN